MSSAVRASCFRKTNHRQPKAPAKRPMYSAFRNFAERLLRIPPEPVSPPGDQSRTQIFRAAPNFYKYLFVLWILKSVFAFLIVSAAFIGPISAGAIYLIKQRGAWAWLLMIIPVF